MNEAWLLAATIGWLLSLSPLPADLPEAGGCTPSVRESTNTETLSFFWGSNVLGVGPSPDLQMKLAASDAAEKWNAPTCNEGGDDFPSFHWTGWKPRGFDGNSDVTLAIRLAWMPSPTTLPTCALYNPIDNRVVVYRSLIDRQGIEHRCPAGLLMDDVQAGRDPRQTGSFSWFRDMVHHELGHSLGLEEITLPQNGCAMGPGLRVDPRPPWNQSMIIKEGCATASECEAADQANSTNRELEQECAYHPLVCILGPPNPPGGTLPFGPDGPRLCAFPGGPGGFPGCEGPDLDSLDEGPNPTYIELHHHSNSSVTVTCIEL